MTALARACLVVMIAAAPAFAEPSESVADRDAQAWRAVFVGAVVLTAGGAGLWLFGETRVDDAEQHLCTGSYRDSCGHAAPTDVATVTRYNDQGFHGRTMERFGVMTSGFAAGVAILAAYEGFRGRPIARDNVAVVPIASPTGGGVSLQLDW